MCKTEKETQMYKTVSWTLWEKVRVGWFERITLKHIYHTTCEIDDQSKSDAWSRALKASAPRQSRWMGWGGMWEEGFRMEGTHVHPWLIHVSVWPKPPQYCKAISLQLKLINKKIQWLPSHYSLYTYRPTNFICLLQPHIYIRTRWSSTCSLWIMSAGITRDC